MALPNLTTSKKRVLVLSVLLLLGMSTSAHSKSTHNRINDKYNQDDMDLIQSRRYEALVAHDIISTRATTTTTNKAQVQEPALPPNRLLKRKITTLECTPLAVEPLSGKRGLGASLDPARKAESLRKLHALKPSWNFSWNSYRIDEQPTDMEFVPMLYGAFDGTSGLISRMERDILPAFEQGLVKRVIAFQSPDRADQADLSVDEVTSYWGTLVDYGIPLTSPTTSNFAGNWMQQFFTAVDAQCLRLEYVALQWYGPPDVARFKAEIQNALDKYGNRPLLITEMAVTDTQATTKYDNQWSQEAVLDFAKTVLPWLESQDYIAGYAWTPYDTNSVRGSSSALFNPDESLTPLGRYYRSITPSTPTGDLSIQVFGASLTEVPSVSVAPSPAPTQTVSPSALPSSSPTKCNEPLPTPPLPGKKGIGLVLTNAKYLQLNLNRLKSLDLSWNYSWGSERIAQQPANLEFIPMIWGAWGASGVRRRIEKDILPQFQQGNVHRYLAFNEPDIEFQSNLSVEHVVGYWPLLQEAGIPLASPSVGHAFGSWMQDFMQQVESKCLRVEYTAIHWYKNPNPQAFKQDMIDAYYRYGQRPILLTEFAPADWDATTPSENRHSPQRVLAFAKEVLPWLERQSFIAGYAWFPFKTSFAPGSTSALFDGDDSETLTALGRYYKR